MLLCRGSEWHPFFFSALRCTGRKSAEKTKVSKSEYRSGFSRGAPECYEEELSVKTYMPCSCFKSDVLPEASIAGKASGHLFLKVSQLYHTEKVVFQGFPKNEALCNHSKM